MTKASAAQASASDGAVLWKASSMTAQAQKYCFTGETKNWFGITLHRIRAVTAIAALGIHAGDLGGWIEGEGNLSQASGDAWVSGNAQVSGDAWVSGNARVSGNAQVFGNAWVSGNAQVFGDAQVSGNTWVSGDARVSCDARVFGNTWVSGNARVQTVNIVATRSDGYTFLVAPTPSGPRIIAGYRYFSFDEAEAHWRKTRADTPLGDETFSILAHLRRMAEIKGFMEPVTEAGAEQ